MKFFKFYKNYVISLSNLCVKEAPGLLSIPTDDHYVAENAHRKNAAVNAHLKRT